MKGMRSRRESLSRGSLGPLIILFNSSNAVCCLLLRPICQTTSMPTMASSLRLPLGQSLSAVRSGSSLRQFYPVAAIPCQCRHFSQAPQLNKKPAAMQNMRLPRPPQPSMRTRARTANLTELPQDLGLLPGTFVRPPWSEMPSIIGMWNERLRMEWLSLKMSFADFVG